MYRNDRPAGTAQVQDELFVPNFASHTWTNSGVMFRMQGGSCIIYGADTFAAPPDWVHVEPTGYPGMLDVVCNDKPVWLARGNGAAYAGRGKYNAHSVFHTTSTGPLLCQLKAFASGKGVLVRQKLRLKADLAKYRFYSAASQSLAQCSHACLRTGLCFGLGFGGGRCELYRRSPADVAGQEGGWGATDSGLKLYACDWPQRK